MTFTSMILENTWGFRSRIDEIYQNTWQWIILIVEDIDTLVNEEITGQNDKVAQGMTVLLEWINSVPLTVVATANDPAKLSARLIRPNRLNEIIPYYQPTSEQKSLVLDQHLNKKWIEISNTAREKLAATNIFKFGTASHIGKFVDNLSASIEIRKYLGEEKVSLSDDEIIGIAEWVNISTDNIKSTEKNIKAWITQSTWKSDESNWAIWFIQ